VSVTEPDGLDDAVAQEWRTALLLAAQVAEWVARRAEQRARTDEQSALAEAGQVGGRYDGERELARAEIAVADNPAWWDQADPTAVARVYATAQAWKDTDPEFTDTAGRVQTAVRDRYGPAVEAQLDDAVTAGRGGSTEELTEDQAQARRAVETELATVLAGEARQDTTAATANVTDATTRTETARDAPAGWDTPQRRDGFAASISVHPDAQPSTPAFGWTGPVPSRRPRRRAVGAAIHPGALHRRRELLRLGGTAERPHRPLPNELSTPTTRRPASPPAAGSPASTHAGAGATSGRPGLMPCGLPLGK